MSRTLDLAVVGAGASGLACACFARAAGLEVALLEAAPRPGGRIHTVEEDGFRRERGPLGWLDREPALTRLVELLGGGACPASEAARDRFLLHRGRLVPLPRGPLSALRSPLVGPGGLLRLLGEPLRRRGPAGRGEEESAASFFHRRLGEDLTATLVDALVSGILAGDPERLSLPAAFPRFAAWEAEHGSLLRGGLAEARRRRRARRGPGPHPSGRLLSYPEGTRGLADRAAAWLGEAWRPGTAVDALAADGGDRVLLAGGREAARARRVVLAVPAPEAGRLLGGLLPDFAPQAEALPWIGIAALHLALPREAARCLPAGYGFLAPRREGFRPLGVQFVHDLFPASVPRGLVQLRVLLGGARDPEVLDLPDTRLLEETWTALEPLLGLSGEPVWWKVDRLRRALPHYETGHRSRAAALEAAASGLGVLLAGDSWYGTGLGATVGRGASLAAKVAAPPRSPAP